MAENKVGQVVEGADRLQSKFRLHLKTTDENRYLIALKKISEL